MTDNLLGLDFESLNAETEALPAPAAATMVAPPVAVGEIPDARLVPEIEKPRWRRKRPLWEVATILGGVFFVFAIVAWLLLTFVFVDQTETESALELPRNRMESVMAELPVGKIRHEGSVEKQEGTSQRTVFIVEIDASIIVQGTASELVQVERMLASYHHRIEEAIDETIRSASQANMNDPETLVLRTRIRDRINAYFGRPVVREVIFSHYRAFHTPIKN